jgi:hypothetical protein
MRFYIKQSGNHYKFFKNKEDADAFLTGFWDSKWRTGVFSKICDSSGDLVTIKFENRPFFWKISETTYKISFHIYKYEVIVKTINHFKGHWTFILNEARYDYFQHAGRKMSLYKNDKQVAKYKMGTVNAWESDTGFVICNSDEDVLLLVALFLMLDMGETNGADMTLDLGNAFAGVKDYNEHWQPTV